MSYHVLSSDLFSSPIRSVALPAGLGALLASCAAPPDETHEIIDNLVQPGFPANDIQVVAGTVYVGGDAEVSLAASREMLQTGKSS